MVYQSSLHILGSILHIYCPTSQKLYVWHWLVEILQLNTIDVLFIYSWHHLLRNTSEYSLVSLDIMCLQSFPSSESILWLKFPILNFQDFHQIGCLLCRHTYMLSLDFTPLGDSLERSYFWINVWYLSKLLSTKTFWYMLVILWLMQNYWVLESSDPIMILIIPN